MAAAKKRDTALNGELILYKLEELTKGVSEVKNTVTSSNQDFGRRLSALEFWQAQLSKSNSSKEGVLQGTDWKQILLAIVTMATLAFTIINTLVGEK